MFFLTKKSKKNLTNEIKEKVIVFIKNENDKIKEEIKYEITEEVIKNKLKEKDKTQNIIKNLLDLYLKFFAMLSPIALIIGGFSLYAKLSAINMISLFPNLIINPTIAINITIVTAIIIIIFMLAPFQYPCMILDLAIKNKSNKYKERYKISNLLSALPAALHAFFLLLIIFLIAWMCIYQPLNNLTPLNKFKIYELSNGAFIAIMIISIIASLLPYKGSTIAERLSINITGSFCTLLFYVFAFFISKDSALLKSIIFILYILNLWFCIKFSQKQNSTNQSYIISSIFSFILGFAIIFIPEAKIGNNIFKALGYIEYSNQANWYLIDKRFIDFSIQSEERFDELRSKFNYKPGKYSKSTSKMTPKITLTSNLTPHYYYKNSFYGYLAWNLGDIKILCPNNVEVHFSKSTHPGNHPINQCLIIKQEYLQPLPNSL